MNSRQVASLKEMEGDTWLVSPVTIRPAEAHLKHLNKLQTETLTLLQSRKSLSSFVLLSHVFPLSLPDLCTLFNLFTDNRSACWCFTACGFHRLSYKELHILPSTSCLSTWGSLFCLSPPSPPHNKIPTALRVPQAVHLQAVEVEKNEGEKRRTVVRQNRSRMCRIWVAQLPGPRCVRVCMCVCRAGLMRDCHAWSELKGGGLISLCSM